MARDYFSIYCNVILTSKFISFALQLHSRTSVVTSICGPWDIKNYFPILQLYIRKQLFPNQHIHY